jgi:hypothetical protein
MKKTDLEKNKGLKVSADIKHAGTPARFGKAAGAVPDRREQRKLDQAQGLVPFAVKLSGDLVQQIQALAQQRQMGLNEVVAELLKKGLEG